MKKKDAVILLAEDEESLQYVFACQIKALGYRTPEFVNNGFDVVKLALQKRIDIIFMDIRMPGLDGISATRRIREQEKGTAIPIIALSAFSQKSACLSAGMNDYMQKPVLLYQIDEMITMYLSTTDKPLPPKLLTEPAKIEIAPDKYSIEDEKLKEVREKIDNLRKHTDIF
jgi:CheY-like chemotaxis protein